MKFDFAESQITLVVAPVDMRVGFSRLAGMAEAFLGIDVFNGKDVVVFISKKRKIAKIIWADQKGTSVITRRLHVGGFESFLARNTGPASRRFSMEDLMTFLDGEPILVRRSTIL